MTTTPDIWHAAVAMMDRYGATAVAEAAIRATENHARGDLPRTAAWQRVVEAIVLLESDRRSADETLH